MEIFSTESEGWLTNAYLIDDNDGHAVLIDGNGDLDPLLEIIRARNLTPVGLIITHHHHDHVMLDGYAGLEVPVYAHELTAQALEGTVAVDHTFSDGDHLHLGDLDIEVMHTPGHADDQVALLVNGGDVFTADLLFKGTVGGTRGPGVTGFPEHLAALRRVAALARETRVHPGHREPTTVGDELDTNVFLRALLNDDAPEGEPCTVGGEPASLLLWGPDYDGTHKAWVRMADGTEHVTGGSQVARSGA